MCVILEIKNPSDAASRLKSQEKNTLVLAEGIRGRGNPNVTVINEAGLYRLILRSDKPQPEPFQTWVVTDVLPAIRKTGTYSIAPRAPAAPMTREQLIPDPISP